MRRALLAVLSLLLAGCVAPGATPPEGPDTAEALPAFLALDHDHTDPPLHVGARGFSLAAYLPICGPPSPCSFGELDLFGDLAIVAIVEPEGGFALVDVADPRAPRLLSITRLGAAFATDVKLAPDGRTAFISTSNFLRFAGRAGLVAEPTTIVGVTRSQGIHAFDVSDPTNPRSLTFEPLGADGVHMMDVHVIDNEMIVFATQPAYTKALAPRAARAAVETVAILRFDGQALERLATHRPADAQPGDSAHDVTIVDDPEEGPLMLSAYFFGLAITSVADPRAPVDLAVWRLADEGLSGDRNTHTVMMTHIDGHRILVATPEQIEDNELLVIDATDLRAPRLIARWHLPGELHDYKGLHWSMHNVNLLNGTAYVAHYHGGVWALDLADPAAPRVRGHFAPIERGNVGPGLAEVWAGPTAPNTWDVVPGKGAVFVSDITSGLYVLDADWVVPQELPYGKRGA